MAVARLVESPPPNRPQVPVLPYLTTSLGANMEEYGYVQTVVGIVQLFGGLVSGAAPWADKPPPSQPIHFPT